MPNRITGPIRVLIVDDDKAVQSAYRKILEQKTVSPEEAALRELRSKLFQISPDAAVPRATVAASLRFEITVCSGAVEAVAALRQALAEEKPFALTFLDMRMPPGPDGAWAAAELRRLDPDIQVILCTAYSDVDPAAIGCRVLPADRLFYLEKPFHPHEVRQLMSALGHRWIAERALMKLAYYDPLTGLPNRELFRRRLTSVMDGAMADSQTVGLLYMDLDNFKRINDTLGHSMGDELLKVTAERLKKCLRAEDSPAENSVLEARNIARIGGDEFAILLPALSQSADADGVAERVLRVLQQPVKLAHHEVVVTPSIGIALFPADGRDIDTLLRHSDLAMYFAKRQGSGLIARYTPAMSASGLQRLTIESQLRGALERNEFHLEYQPQFDLADGSISGMEALIRWRNAELGLVSPAEFVPIAEETGMIIAIGEWVLRAACLAAKAWNTNGGPPIRMAVNVSGVQFSQRDLPKVVSSVLADVGLDPHLLEVEITESVVMKDEGRAIAAIAALKATGVSVAIDDFGTGHSSLARLRDLAVDRLKIDRSFIENIATSRAAFAVVNAIIGMARSLELSVVAEGVEDFSQLSLLKDQLCDSAQGFFLSRPIAEQAGAELLSRVAADMDPSRTQRLRHIAEWKTG